MMKREMGEQQTALPNTEPKSDMGSQQTAPPGAASQFDDRRPFNLDPREQRPVIPYPINTDPREQPHWQPIPPVMAPRPPRRRSRWWVWLIAGLLVLFMLFGGAASALAFFLHRTVTQTQSYTVSALPKIILNNNSGSVQIDAGSSSQVSIVAHEHTGFGNNPARFHSTYDAASNTITITVDPSNGSGFFNDRSVDFDLTVPSQANLQIKTESGSVQEDGVSGTIDLGAESGSVEADNASGTLTLHTESGSVDVDHVNGVMTLTTESGSITAEDARLSGSSRLQTESGSIHFSGSVDPNGAYTFKTESGSIDLTLPQDGSMRVDASTDAGSINVDSDFSGINVQRSGPGSQASGTVGTGPSYPKVSIQTNSGSITINAES